MKSRILETDEARDIHALAFPDDHWAGDDQTYWGVYDETHLAGLCSAVYRERMQYVFLSRAAVTVGYRGLGLQRKMIHLRCQWGRRQGATLATTYTSLNNYESIANLIRCSFRMVETPTRWAGVGNRSWHYFERNL